MHPTYYVRHPDDTYSVVAPQPAEVLVDAAITTLNQLGRMVGNSEHENNRIRAALTAAFSEAAPLATPADAGAGEALTNARIIEIADQTRTAESRDGDYILPISFAREIEKELARLSKPGAPVTAEPVAWAFPDGLERLARVRGGYADSPLLVVHAKDAGDYNVPLYTHPAPADRDAIRDQALEEAAMDCEKEYNKNPDRRETSAAYFAKRIRALKSMERAADAAETRDAKGGEHG